MSKCSLTMKGPKRQQSKTFHSSFPESTVVVSPSMSGEYAIPLVFSSNPILSGWVPVAPVSIKSHEVTEYQSLQLPVLAVYGEYDAQFRGEVRKRVDF